MTSTQPENRQQKEDATTIRAALRQLPMACKYHGLEIRRQQFGGHGPCCDTGAVSVLRADALTALDRLAGAL